MGWCPECGLVLIAGEVKVCLYCRTGRTHSVASPSRSTPAQTSIGAAAFSELSPTPDLTTPGAVAPKAP